jgi:hypothetical protein
VDPETNAKLWYNGFDVPDAMADVITLLIAVSEMPFDVLKIFFGMVGNYRSFLRKILNLICRMKKKLI